MDKPLPNTDGLGGEFYAFCARGELRFQRCAGCGAWRHPPRVLCAACRSNQWSWELSSGRGEVFTWTVVHQPLHPAFVDDVPYAVVVAELEEGPRLVAGLRELAPSELALGLPVEVVFEPRTETVSLPCFRPRVS